MPRAARNFLILDVFSQNFPLNLMILGSKNPAFPKKLQDPLILLLFGTQNLLGTLLCIQKLGGYFLVPKISTLLFGTQILGGILFGTQNLGGRPIWVPKGTHLGTLKNTGSIMFPNPCRYDSAIFH